MVESLSAQEIDDQIGLRKVRFQQVIADIRTVLKAISEFSGRNIVLGSTVKATVRVSLKNVGWEEALRTVLRANGLDYLEEGGIIRVDEAAKLQSEMVDREAARAKAAEVAPLETRIVKLNFANASELAASLQSSLTRRGSITVDKRTNTLIIQDVPQNLPRRDRDRLPGPLGGVRRRLPSPCPR